MSGPHDKAYGFTALHSNKFYCTYLLNKHKNINVKFTHTKIKICHSDKVTLSPMWSLLSFSKEDDYHEFPLSAYLCCRFLRNPCAFLYILLKCFHSSLVTSKVLWLKFFGAITAVPGYSRTLSYNWVWVQLLSCSRDNYYYCIVICRK